MKRLYRNTKDKKIAGVCAGLGEYFDIDPVIVRLLFLMSIFWGGGVIAYLIAWFIVPEKTAV
ncbi:MAG: PspC domain-containing protein [Candidatus Marinimicrobia bacterium]|nr:PspC domain-containing protein [Candidatus Neomarinimicrobiota bacterium]